MLLRAIIVAAFLISASAVHAQCYDGYEADVHPRYPFFTDYEVSFFDWQIITEMLLGLKTPFNGCEFASADCAPRHSAGDGVLSASDFVQARRYSVGLDLPVPERGGPTNLLAWLPPPSATRVVRLSSTNLLRGERAILSVNLAATGQETAISFTLKLPPASFSVLSITSSGIINLFHEPTSVFVNTNRLTEGLLGVFAFASTNWNAPVELLRLEVLVSPFARWNDAPRFTNNFVALDVASTNAEPLAVTFDDSSAALETRPALKLHTTTNGLGLAVFGNPGSIYEIERSTNCVLWSGGTFVTNGLSNSVLFFTNETTKFFRARVAE